MQTESLDTLCSLIVDCPHRTAPRSGAVFGYAVGTTAIDVSGRIDFAKSRPVSEETYRIWTARAVPRPGDLIFCREAPVGPVAILPSQERVCLGQRTMLLRPDPRLIDHRWLAYKLRSPITLQTLLSRSEGSTVAHLNVADVRRFELEVPDLDRQRQVADVLAALDHKIESNRGYTSALAAVVLAQVQEAAHASERRLPISEIAVLVKEPGDDARPYVGLDDMPLGSTALSRWRTDDAPTGASWLFERGDLLFGKLRPYFRKVGVAPIAGRCSREILVLRPAEPQHYGLLVGTAASQSFIDFCSTTASTGTRMPRSEWKDASRYEIGIPPEAVLARLTDLTHRHFTLVATLVSETRTLTAIRDALLPKLVSGQIRVPLSDDVEEQVGAAIESVA